MSHQDTDRLNPIPQQVQDLKAVLDGLFTASDFETVQFRRDCSWTALALVFAGIFWAWSGEITLGKRFEQARKAVARMRIRSRAPATTYQAFLKMLRSWTPRLSSMVVEALRRRMREDLAERFEVAGFLVFGVDGSRLGLPRTWSNEARYTAASVARRRGEGSRSRGRASTKEGRRERDRQKKANSPQMWVTVLSHLGTGLPWNWRLGPSDSSERHHFREMIPCLPEAALVAADAGFVGYDTWKELLDSGRHLLIRVGANVRLLKGLGYARRKGDWVYLWPDKEARKQGRPLVLRLVVARDGRQPIFLVTSVLDQESLSDRHVVQIYAKRWEIELFYRHFKQTYERSKLRSQTAEHAELEATWSLLGLWAMMLHAQVELSYDHIPSNLVSVAKVLHAFRRTLNEYKSEPDDGESLGALLSVAVVDGYERGDKTSRDYPRKKHGHSIGARKSAMPHRHRSSWLKKYGINR